MLPKKLHREISASYEEALTNLDFEQEVVSLIDPAVNSVATKANAMSVISASTVVGVFIGLLVSLLIQGLDNRVRDESDLRRASGFRLLGIIPSFSKEILNKQFVLEKEEFSQTGVEVSHSSIDIDEATLAGKIDDVKEQSDLGGDTASLARDAVVSKDLKKETTKLKKSAGQVARVVEAPASSLLLLTAPLSTESEAFRHVRTSIELTSGARAHRSVLITSSRKGDGKTTIALNLATAFACYGHRTLLIDGDLRMPSLQDIFGHPRDVPGLADYLAGDEDYTNIICNGSVENLSLLFAGRPSVFPGELIGSNRMQELLSVVYDEFDQIIVDSPPIGRVSDALLLSRYVDGVALIGRSGVTPSGSIRIASNRLREANAPVIGTILNDLRGGQPYQEKEYYVVEIVQT